MPMNVVPPNDFICYLVYADSLMPPKLVYVEVAGVSWFQCNFTTRPTAVFSVNSLTLLH